MNFFNRIFKMGQAEAHSALDNLEDPIKLTEQGIRDLKSDLDKSLQALAEVKAMAIRARKEAESNKEKSKDYENKAMLILQKAENGGIDAAEADRLASEALLKQQESSDQATRALADQKKFENNVSQLDVNVKKIRSSISHYENELKTLKARVKVSSATKNLNKQLSKIDSSGTVSMLERMKEKVEQDEALAESYGEIANESRSLDEELDEAINSGDATTKASDSLAALKAKMASGKK